jgi:hypothetical protein
VAASAAEAVRAAGSKCATVRWSTGRDAEAGPLGCAEVSLVARSVPLVVDLASRQTTRARDGRLPTRARGCRRTSPYCVDHSTASASRTLQALPATTRTTRPAPASDWRLFAPHSPSSWKPCSAQPASGGRRSDSANNVHIHDRSAPASRRSIPSTSVTPGLAGSVGSMTEQLSRQATELTSPLVETAEVTQPPEHPRSTINSQPPEAKTRSGGTQPGIRSRLARRWAGYSSTERAAYGGAGITGVFAGVAAIIAALVQITPVLLADERTAPSASTSATSPAAESSPSPSPVESNPAEVTATATYYRDECSSFLLPKPVSELGASPPRETLGEWARSNGGVTSENFGPATGGTQRIMVTIAGGAATPVTITDLTFEAVERGPAIIGPVVSNQCGDETVARYAEIDLDRNPPAIISSSATPVSVGADLEVEPIKFPYLVSESETETLLLIASTHNYVAWRARLSWSNGTTSGTYTVDDDGDPFRVSSSSASTGAYGPNGSGGWL